MHFSALLPLCLAPLAASLATPHHSQQPFTPKDNHHPFAPVDRRVPTAYESAVMARRILALTPLATLSTNFPATSHPREHRPDGLAGTAIGLIDYIADCEDSGNPTILSLSIGTTFRNAAAGSNISVAIQWTPPYAPSKRIGGPVWHNAKAMPYSAANLPRFSLIGHIEPIPAEEVESHDIMKCYTEVHPDAKYWLPGGNVHHGEWARLVVDEIYFVGGFGDRAYIGWLDVNDWKSITQEQWESIELPGEQEGWKEW